MVHNISLSYGLRYHRNVLVGAQTVRPGLVAAGERWVCRLVLTGRSLWFTPSLCFVFLVRPRGRIDFGLPLNRLLGLAHLRIILSQQRGDS
jgi:hypothetical protein